MGRCLATCRKLVVFGRRSSEGWCTVGCRKLVDRLTRDLRQTVQRGVPQLGLSIPLKTLAGLAARRVPSGLSVAHVSRAERRLGQPPIGLAAHFFRRMALLTRGVVQP